MDCGLAEATQPVMQGLEAGAIQVSRLVEEEKQVSRVRHLPPWSSWQMGLAKPIRSQSGALWRPLVEPPLWSPLAAQSPLRRAKKALSMAMQSAPFPTGWYPQRPWKASGQALQKGKMSALIQKSSSQEFDYAYRDLSFHRSKCD